MIRDITIGQYYPADSSLHRLDPRVKFIGTFLFLISLFVADSFWGYLLATCFLGGIIFLSKVPIKFMIKGLKPLFIILLITVLFNLFLIPGQELWSLGFFTITVEGVQQAVKIGIRQCNALFHVTARNLFFRRCNCAAARQEERDGQRRGKNLSFHILPPVF